MAQLNPVVIVQTHICILFLPIAKYSKAGDVSKLSVFGIQIYARVGDLKSLLGIVWRKPASEMK
jgi:hypothetical protein